MRNRPMLLAMCFAKKYFSFGMWMEQKYKSKKGFMHKLNCPLTREWLGQDFARLLRTGCVNWRRSNTLWYFNHITMISINSPAIIIAELFHTRFFYHNWNLWKFLFISHPSSYEMIAAKFDTRHENHAAVTWATFCYDLMTTIWVKTKQNFRRI